MAGVHEVDVALQEVTNCYHAMMGILDQLENHFNVYSHQLSQLLAPNIVVPPPEQPSTSAGSSSNDISSVISDQNMMTGTKIAPPQQTSGLGMTDQNGRMVTEEFGPKQVTCVVCGSTFGSSELMKLDRSEHYHRLKRK